MTPVHSPVSHTIQKGQSMNEDKRAYINGEVESLFEKGEAHDIKVKISSASGATKWISVDETALQDIIIALHASARRED